MNASAYGNAAGAVGGTSIVADTETLPRAAANWRALLDIRVAVPQQVPAYQDPASSAVAAAMADWPAIQSARIARRDAAADQLMGWVGKTSGAFAFTDRGGANAISAAGASPPGAMLV